MPSHSTAPPRLGNVLIERGYITVEQLNAALAEQRAGGGKLLGEILIEQGFCTDDQIIEDNAQAEVTLIETAIEDIGDTTDFAGQSPVIRLVNYIIYNAVKEGASDIHIEPGERCLRIRNRIDGCLYKALEVPLNLLGAVTSRIKIMASLDISERRLPQDGRVHVLLDGRKIDLRRSTFPGSRGEKTAIRVLDTRSVSLNLRDLGFAEDILTPLQSSIQAPNGIILVTGPTGSGKSTTLYAALNEISSMANNI